MDNSKYSLFLKVLTVTKIIGLVFLIIHFITKEQFPIWDSLLIYLFLYLLFRTFLAIPVLLVFELINKVRYKIKPSLQLSDEKQSYSVITGLQQKLRGRPWEILLIPGEDGFFFLPLVYIGITPLSAAIASGLFAAMHFDYRSLRKCAIIFVTHMIICLTILPHSIIPIISGHFSLDLIAVLLLGKGRKELETKIKELETNPNNPAKAKTK